MKVAFSQVYIELGANFPFSVHFQRRLTKDVTALVQPSAKFIEIYGSDFELIFRISAKHNLSDNEVRGPTVFRKAKDVEYTIFLPFDVIVAHSHAPKHALMFLLNGVCDVLDRLEIDTERLRDAQQSLIEAICADPSMLDTPSWSEAENNTPVRKIFADFFGKR
jgi:hypothetical protein